MQVLQTVPTMQDISSSVGAVVQILDGRESRVLVRYTWNTDIVSELTPDGPMSFSISTASAAFWNLYWMRFSSDLEPSI